MFCDKLHVLVLTVLQMYGSQFGLFKSRECYRCKEVFDQKCKECVKRAEEIATFYRMRFEKNRIESFASWPCSDERKKTLGRHGFMSTDEKGLVQCVYCDCSVYLPFHPRESIASLHASFAMAYHAPCDIAGCSDELKRIKGHNCPMVMFNKFGSTSEEKPPHYTPGFVNIRANEPADEQVRRYWLWSGGKGEEPIEAEMCTHTPFNPFCETCVDSLSNVINDLKTNIQ